MTAEEYVAGQIRRAEDTAAWCDWLAWHRIDVIVEPTLPIVAPVRGPGYDEAFSDLDDLSLTHYWDWTGFPVVSLSSGVGSRSGLPTSVSLIGAPGTEWDLLGVGRGTPGRARYGVAVIDAAAVTAIDVHVHTELTRDGHDPMPPRVARSSREVLQERPRRCRRSTTWRSTTASGTSPPCCSPSTGSRVAGSRRSRTRRSSTRPHGTRT